ncbi:MAG TPA: glycosyltransferase [Gemmataceae bacterium]|nr:glycosyltransferase [Gemmataceae bacterium]
MRILTMTSVFPSPVQPHYAPYNRHQLAALTGRHEVRVINPILWTVELGARWRGKAALPDDRRSTVDGIPVEHPRYWYPPKVLRGWYGHCYRRSVRRAFDRAVANFRPDLVFAPWAYPDGWAAVRLGARANLPVVVKLHGSDVRLAGQFAGRVGQTARAVCQADGVVAVSQDLANHADGLGADPRRIRVVYDGVDASVFRPGSLAASRKRLGLPADGNILLFIGNLVPVKGLDVLIRACGRLARAGTEFTCLMIGQGPLRASLERQAAAEGLRDRVRLLGSKPHADLADWYRAANLFVLSSHSEGVPCVLLEAAACGTPFVASRVGGIPEIAHFGPSRLVPPGNPDELARAIAASLAGPTRSVRPFPPMRAHADAAADLEAFFNEVVRDYHAARDRAAPALAA